MYRNYSQLQHDDLKMITPATCGEREMEAWHCAHSFKINGSLGFEGDEWLDSSIDLIINLSSPL
jgi:hypothetical protein